MEYTAPILRTKLHRPRVSQELVRRLRLETRLNQCLDRQLTLVSAPAGFGKTTLVCQWLEACDCPAAWLSLDEGDDELPTFLRYLIAAIRTLDSDACPTTQSLLDSPQLPPVEYLATSLINELCEVPQDFILVLDDYHIQHAALLGRPRRHLQRQYQRISWNLRRKPSLPRRVEAWVSPHQPQSRPPCPV